MTPVDILIVDDSVADRTSLRIAFERCGLPLKLHFAASGRAALDLLGVGEPDMSPISPQMMLFDVKMPGMSGLELLGIVKQSPQTALIPVIMLSGSDDPSDVRQAYESRASGYICKPLEADELDEIAAVIGRLATRVFIFAERAT
jgi:CheY-like chemotaxis protein